MPPTCSLCSEPLGRFHAYHLHRPDQVISLLADHVAAHLGCIESRIEETALTSAPETTHLTCIATVRVGSDSRSGRLVRLPHPETGRDIAHLHLFTPDTLRFLHLSTHPAAGDGVHTLTRPATPAEIIAWMQPAITDALAKAASDDERRTLTHHLGLIQTRLPEHDRAAFKAHLATPALTTDH